MARSETSNTAVATASSSYTDTETAQITEASSFSYADLADRKSIQGAAIGGIIVGVLAGATLLLLALWLLCRRWKLHRHNRNPKNRGVLPGPRVPTGSTVPASLYRRSDSWNTPPKSERSQPLADLDLEANVGQQDIGLQYYSESNYSQTEGPASSKKTAKERTEVNIDDNTSAVGSPARHAQILTSSPESVENESITLHSRRSNATIDWPLPKSTVSSPALLMKAPEISPLSPLSPFGDFDAVKQQVEEQIEKERHRQDAYWKLSGEVAGAALTKKPGSVARARKNIMASREAPKKAGSVARARQNIMAVRGAAEQPGKVTSPRQNTIGLMDFLREHDAQCGDETDVETNETGTVVRRKNKRAH
ncbi:uncharacterized protein N0V89_004640 [Didymosphaeria variabile]|uniref:Uncharacterized protein n=1 Tax=Didymosphaeria variabile TaxID=1932322 RepID=A0A9W9CDE5_9PLEO|nr:uncharacterized protein N0V89_004640 [Didymosphaeria variabile]KAJ4356605.1 hypothetical protein N0V89_004640 [Didymosphaeria variabile]